MAIYTTLFLAEPEQLPAGFPDWKTPLDEPVERNVINPFTRKEMVITTREPTWDDFDPKSVQIPAMRVANISGDYAAYLEKRIPPFVRSQPHWCGKNLTLMEFEPLVALLCCSEEKILQDSMFAPPAFSSLLLEFPETFLARMSSMRSLGEHDWREVAEKWADALSSPAHTHSVSGRRLEEDWSVDDALRVMDIVENLVQEHAGTQRMYLLWEY